MLHGSKVLNRILLGLNTENLAGLVIAHGFNILCHRELKMRWRAKESYASLHDVIYVHEELLEESGILHLIEDPVRSGHVFADVNHDRTWMVSSMRMPGQGQRPNQAVLILTPLLLHRQWPDLHPKPDKMVHSARYKSWFCFRCVLRQLASVEATFQPV